MFRSAAGSPQASRNEWVIGPISTTVFSQRIRGCHGGVGHGSFLSPIAHRKSPTIVSFDIGHSNLRRHSSPGLEARRIIKSCTESKSGQNLVLQSAMKKYGCRDLRCCSSQTSNRYMCRNDVTMVCQRLQKQQQQQQQYQQQNKRQDDKQRTAGSVELLPVPLPTKQQRKLRHTSRNGSGDSRVENPTIYIEGVGLSADEAECLPRKVAGTHKILGRTKSATDPSYTSKLPVCSSSFVSDDYRRDKTGDDSEMEDRLGRLIYEIDYSVTESVDESKIRSQDFEPMSYAVDAETQTHAADTVD